MGNSRQLGGSGALVTNDKIGVGVIGCGFISGIYLENMPGFEVLEVVACADISMERAKARAAEYGVPKACTVEELLADPTVDLVVNLTVPAAHYDVAKAAIASGKSVYNEKPLAIQRAEGRQLLEDARSRGVRVGGAPDTFLGAGLQTCRDLIDEGGIGAPVAATAFMLCHGHEHWHPDPAFYYQVGGGPMFDMGPYYLTALMALLGPVRRVTGSTRITFPQRTISSKPKAGEKIDVQVPTHVAAVLDFAGGTIATIVTSFDVWSAETPRLEIYGSTGSLSLPDPNMFDGPVRIRQPQEDTWAEIPIERPYRANCRGLGVADMAHGLRSGRPHRANGELAYHVLDVMHAIHDASSNGRHVDVESTFPLPAPLPCDLPAGALDD
ncbi:MAG: Gfo/Idh/MocA family protein [Thermomicrobiales bacterium]